MNIDPKSETQKPVCAKCGGKGYYQVGYAITSQAVCECQRFSNTTLDAQEWNFNQFKALQSENLRLQKINEELVNALTKTRELIYFKDAEIVGGWLVKPDQIDFGTVLTTIDRAIQTPEP